MQKIMFSDRFGLTQAVLEGRKTNTRRIVPDGTPLGNWEETIKHSRYKVGEVVAIAECYKDVLEEIGRDSLRNPLIADAGYMNKMFVRAGLMPHRIRITNVRVERLQDISDEDCLREGILKGFEYHIDPAGNEHFGADEFAIDHRDERYLSPRDAFAALIDKVSGKGTWASNPWVFVYEFELVK